MTRSPTLHSPEHTGAVPNCKAGAGEAPQLAATMTFKQAGSAARTSCAAAQGGGGAAAYGMRHAACAACAACGIRSFQHAHPGWLGAIVEVQNLLLAALTQLQGGKGNGGDT